MSPRTATITGRSLAEELMVDAGKIFHPAAPSPHHTGPCLVRAGAPSGRLDFEEGDTTTRRICFPHDVIATVGDIVEITDSDDSALVGERLRVVGTPSQSFVLYREYVCEVLG